MGYNSACVGNIIEKLAPVFAILLLNDVREILPRVTPVATATKFQTKAVITRLVWHISRRSLRLTGVFLCQAIKRCQPNFTTTDPGYHGNEIVTKSGADF